MTPRVSAPQAACNALAAWLSRTMTPDITVIPRWPEPSVKLPPKAISIVRVGRKSRIDAAGIWQTSRTNVSATKAQVNFMVGAIEQPVQLDVWASVDLYRDDMLAQLDDVLYAGVNQTLGKPGNPVRDGLLLKLGDGFDGWVDFWFDDVDMYDSPDSVQRSEFRATLNGTARMAYGVSATTPRLLSATFKAQSSEFSPATPGTPYDTTTITPSGRTHGQSGS